ncbi:MAG: DUF6883 domain-containing protein [Tepidiformaceae bacterium]
MKLPNAEHAVIDGRKLTEYVLDAGHGRGRHKARLFQSIMNIGPGDAGVLMDLLRQLAAEDEVDVTRETDFGIEYVLHHPLPDTDPPAALRHVWIVLHGEDVPRLVTCFPVRLR